MDTKIHARMRNWALIVCLLFLQACASTNTIQTARSQYFSGQHELALETLDEVSPDSRNRLLVEFDRGAIAFSAGRHRESSRALLQASSTLEQLDFISVSEQSKALVTNDWATAYRGESSERLWVHSLQMMNFLLLNEPESAAVEARQAIQLLGNHTEALKKDWFTRALVGLSLEQANQLDSAQIEYNKLHEDADFSEGIARLAWNNAKRLGRRSAMKKIASGRDFESYDSAIVVFVDAGRIPTKLAGSIAIDTDQFIAFPIYPEYPEISQAINASLNGEAVSSTPITTNLISVARSSLSERGNKIALKSVVRAGVKNAIAKEARKEDTLLGMFVTAALYITELPDTRSWETLPGQLSMLVIPVEPGTHTVTVEVGSGSSNRVVTLDNINVERGQRVFRTLHKPNLITPALTPQTVPASVPAPAEAEAEVPTAAS